MNFALNDPKLPSVTIGIPALNEVNYIEDVINSLLYGSYPNITEVIVADGGSTDGTLQLLDRLSNKDSRIRCIPNPKRKQSEGLNLIIQEAKGDLLLRADAHSVYAPDYVGKSVEKLLEFDAENVGGAQRFIAKNWIQAGIALASRSLLGSGGARYRDPHFNGAVDTVFLGCYRVETLRKVGGFKLLSKNYVNEDAELNLRLNKYKKGSVLISSSIKVWYLPRDSFTALWRQYYNYGRSRVLTWLRHPVSNQLRGLTPFLFISFMILLFLIDVLFLTSGFIGLFVFSVYLITLIYESVRISLKMHHTFKDEFWRSESEPPGLIQRIISVSITMFLMHLAHFSGALVQLAGFGKK